MISRTRAFFTSSDGSLYEGWRVVGGSAAVLLLATGSLVYGLGVVFEPIQTELALSTFTVSVLFSLRSEVGGIAAPFVGSALDKVGPATVVRVGIVLASGGCLLLSFARDLWLFIPAMLLIAVGNTSAGGQVGNHAVASWFRRRRGRAMSIMTLGGAAGGGMAALIGIGVDTIGWRLTLRALALVIVVGGMLLARWVRPRPEDHPQPIDGVAVSADEESRIKEWDIPFGAAIRTPAFRRLLLFNVFSDFARLAYLTHLAKFVSSDLGASETMAGITVAVSALASLPGRLIAGLLVDRIAVRVVAALTMAPFLVGLLILASATRPWHALAAAALGGLGFGASVPTRPALYVGYFGMSIFGRVMGTGRLLSTTGGAAGGALVGLIVDNSGGDYFRGWMLALLVGVCSIPVALMARPPVQLQQAHTVAPGD